MKITEKVSYLRGLIDGLEIDPQSKEGKIYAAIVDVLNDCALSVEDIEDEVDEVVELIDIIDEDLGSLEADVYELDEDEDEDFFLDEDFYEVKCPSCGQEITLDAQMFDAGELNCPNCGEYLEFDPDDLDELEILDEGCGCGCNCEISEDDEDDK